MTSTEHTDIVASVSGTYNETLTLTTGGITTNQLRNMHFKYNGVRYHIASNTTTTITLDTPTVAYDDLTGVSISVIKSSDYLWKNSSGQYKQIDNILKINNDNNFTTEINEESADDILEMIEGEIHDAMNRVGNPIPEGQRGHKTIFKFILVMVSRTNHQRQFNKLTNQMEIVFGSFVPWISDREVIMLNKMDDENDGPVVYDQKHSNGGIIEPSVHGGDHYSW